MVHAAHECSIHPAIASAPVAVLSVWRLIWGHIVLVPPPQTFLLVEQSSGQRVTAPTVHLHRMVCIFSVTSHLIDLHIQGHGHLYGVDPCPPTVELILSLGIGCLHLVVEVLNDLGNLLFATTLEIAVHIGLSAALIVGIVGLHTVARRPLMERGPAVGIVSILWIGIYLI